MAVSWCVKSFDRDSHGRVTGERWCRMARRVYGDQPAYRDSEQTACCGGYVTLPCGYEKREPTCDGKLGANG